MTPGSRRRILVIKLGALGDLVQAFAPFAAIRAHHPGDHITLLTTAPFVGLSSASPWFDAVTVDARPAPWNLRGLRRLRAQLSGFDFVYDLQTSARSSRYRRLAGDAGWSGIAPGASHPDADPDRDRLHTRIRQAGQLAQAGIASVGTPDLSWLASYGPRLPGRLALLVPGASPKHPQKRWPAERFGALATGLARDGFVPVIAGAAADRPLAAIIRRCCPPAHDLTGATSLLELGGLAGRASLAIGNDTGPMHLAAAMGCPSLVLFSAHSDPALTAPVGATPDQVALLRVRDLSGLALDTVTARLRALAPREPRPA